MWETLIIAQLSVPLVSPQENALSVRASLLYRQESCATGENLWISLHAIMRENCQTFFNLLWESVKRKGPGRGANAGKLAAFAASRLASPLGPLACLSVFQRVFNKKCPIYRAFQEERHSMPRLRFVNTRTRIIEAPGERRRPECAYAHSLYVCYFCAIAW